MSKTIGTDQLLAMKFERLPLPDKWEAILGRLPSTFMMIVYGESGEGKTEFCMQLAKELTQHGRVEWMGYETAHDGDIQDAVARNSMKGLPITWTDPFAKLNDDAVLFDELLNKMAKKKSAKYWVIDSIDATGFDEKQVMHLKNKVGKKKGIVFIAHAKGKVPEKAVSRKIEFYGQVGIYVKHCIAFPEKNRFGGRKPYIISEEIAKERNPLFFGITPAPKAEQAPVKKTRKKRTKKVNDDQ
jgi:hypothetical protein